MNIPRVNAAESLIIIDAGSHLKINKDIYR